jgi:hypothetical protein
MEYGIWNGEVIWGFTISKVTATVLLVCFELGIWGAGE